MLSVELDGVELSISRLWREPAARECIQRGGNVKTWETRLNNALATQVDPKRTFVATDCMSQTEVERSLRPRRRISRLLGTRR